MRLLAVARDPRLGFGDGHPRGFDGGPTALAEGLGSLLVVGC
jgi:hypothetical protein